MNQRWLVEASVTPALAGILDTFPRHHDRTFAGLGTEQQVTGRIGGGSLSANGTANTFVKKSEHAWPQRSTNTPWWRVRSSALTRKSSGPGRVAPHDNLRTLHKTYGSE
jgi:hypothetical protein